MTAMLVIAVLFAVLFMLAYITRRRFGVLGLGLVAGTIISSFFSGIVGSLIGGYAHWAFTANSIAVPPRVTAMIVLTLAPALALLIAGPRYDRGKSVIISSLAFATVALLLIMGQTAANFGSTDAMYRFEGTLNSFFPIIIVAVVIVSVIDAIMGNGPSFKSSSKH